MDSEKYQGKYRRGSFRAQWHDYNGGEYFITICTKDRKHYFGEIADGEMHLSEVGKYTDECLQKISEHNPYAQVPIYAIMPDHIHLIVIVSADIGIVPNNSGIVPWRNATATEGKDKKMQEIANKQGRLSTAIGGFKQAVTRFARQNDIPFAWQSLFHDHIIRDQNEMNRIAEYIENNVAKWESDKQKHL